MADTRPFEGVGETDLARGACWMGPINNIAQGWPLMTLLIGALTMGLILALLALGVYMSFRIFNFPDITADGRSRWALPWPRPCWSHGHNPVLATAAAAVAGAMAGAITGVLPPSQINALLTGILVMTALYSVNLHVMGKSNVPLLEVNAGHVADNLGARIFGGHGTILMSPAGPSACATPRCSCASSLFVAWSVGLLYCSSAPTSARPCAPPATTRR